MPMIIASAVISTGRNRVKPARDRRGQRVIALGEPLARETHDQDAVGGRNAHAHDRAGQRRHRERRARDEQHPNDAGERRRQRADDDERVEPGLEVDDDKQIDQHDRQRQAGEQLACRPPSSSPSARATRQSRRAARPSRSPQDLPDVAGNGAEIAAGVGRINVDDGLHRVMGNDRRGDAASYRRDDRRGSATSRSATRERSPGLTWNSSQYCGVCATMGYATPFFGIDPEGRRDLEAAGQAIPAGFGRCRLRSSPSCSARTRSTSTFEFRVGGRLLDARVGDAGNARDLFQQHLGVVAVLILVRAEHLNVDRRRQAEVEDLRNDVGGQKGERRAGETARQQFPQRLRRSRRSRLRTPGAA